MKGIFTKKAFLRYQESICVVDGMTWNGKCGGSIQSIVSIIKNSGYAFAATGSEIKFKLPLEFVK